MPVAEHAEGASVHVGEVEEVVEVVVGHGAQHGQELQGQVCGHLGGRAKEVAQGPGAGADHQAPTGAQVPREGPALHVGEDLRGRAGMGGLPLPSAHRPASLSECPFWLQAAGLWFGFQASLQSFLAPSSPSSWERYLLPHPGGVRMPFSFSYGSFFVMEEESGISRLIL